jgi:hypothetical protein
MAALLTAKGPSIVSTKIPPRNELLLSRATAKSRIQQPFASAKTLLCLILFGEFRHPYIMVISANATGRLRLRTKLFG